MTVEKWHPNCLATAVGVCPACNIPMAIPRWSCINRAICKIYSVVTYHSNSIKAIKSRCVGVESISLRVYALDSRYTGDPAHENNSVNKIDMWVGQGCACVSCALALFRFTSTKDIALKSVFLSYCQDLRFFCILAYVTRLVVIKCCFS